MANIATELQDAGLSAEDAQMLQECLEEGREEARRTGELSAVWGLKAFGSTDAGVRATINIGAQMVKNGLLLKATEYFTALLAVEPFHPRVHMWLGLCAQRQKLYHHALNHYSIATQLKPDDGLLWLYKGEAALLMQERDNGVEALTKGLALARNVGALRAHVQRAEKLLQVAGVANGK